MNWRFSARNDADVLNLERRREQCRPQLGFVVCSEFRIFRDETASWNKKEDKLKKSILKIYQTGKPIWTKHEQEDQTGTKVLRRQFSQVKVDWSIHRALCLWISIWKGASKKKLPGEVATPTTKSSLGNSRLGRDFSRDPLGCNPYRFRPPEQRV